MLVRSLAVWQWPAIPEVSPIRVREKKKKRKKKLVCSRTARARKGRWGVLVTFDSGGWERQPGWLDLIKGQLPRESLVYAIFFLHSTPHCEQQNDEVSRGGLQFF